MNTGAAQQQGSSRPTKFPHDYKATFRTDTGETLTVRGLGDNVTHVDRSTPGIKGSNDRTYFEASAVHHNPDTGELSFNGGNLGGHDQGRLSFRTVSGDFEDNRVRNNDAPQGNLPTWSGGFGNLQQHHPKSAPSGMWKANGK